MNEKQKVLIIRAELWQDVAARIPIPYAHPTGVVFRVRPGTRGRVIAVTTNAVTVLFDGHVLPLAIDKRLGNIPATLAPLEH